MSNIVEKMNEVFSYIVFIVDLKLFFQVKLFIVLGGVGVYCKKLFYYIGVMVNI